MTLPAAQPQHIWRINAYLILITCALASALLLVGLALLAWEWQRARPTPVANLVATDVSGHVQRERLSYRLRHTQGDVVVLDVVADQQIEQAMGSKIASGVMRNQLFVNVADGSSARLLPDDRGLVVQVWAVRGDGAVSRTYGPETDERPLPVVRARLYEVVSQDSNGDGRLSASDQRRLLLARADGSAPVTLAEGMARMDGAALDAAGELRLTAVPAGGGMQLYRFDLSRWAALPPVSLPSLPKEH
ncbi:hypothetical protein [Vandammella animalimorsus]|uniref:Uncharacterized protein n=1 Tax=Vandammella animalimorsus TaxID=2029117 RepID=A0A2A2AF89_9BURK|nr:hypothetical protein [Vandammella animalimorsus]PAT36456.1 hypothetical protein CK625_10970 [Vandammella animalimorsus]